MTIPAAPSVTAAGTQLAENGRVLATLDDWRAIMFVLVAVIVLLIFFVIWVMVLNSRRDSKIADAQVRVAEALESLTVEIRVMRGLAAGRAPPDG